MTNRSGLEARGRAVLIQMDEPKQAKNSAIILPDLVREKTDMVEQRATVIQIGETAWHDEGYWAPWCFGLLRRWTIKPRARVGERVLVTKFAGYMTIGPADGKRYRLVNDRDIFAAITEECEFDVTHVGAASREPVVALEGAAS